MFQKGDYVVYGPHGVCSIVDLETRSAKKEKTEYYVLEPLDQIGTRFYIPTNNQVACSKLSPIITKQALIELLKQDTIFDNAWIPDENQRKQHYKALISSGDRVALIRMIHTLHQQKILNQNIGRKLHLCDDSFLRDAQRLLDAEFSMVLEIPREQIGTYIQSMKLHSK